MSQRNWQSQKPRSVDQARDRGTESHRAGTLFPRGGGCPFREQAHGGFPPGEHLREAQCEQSGEGVPARGANGLNPRGGLLQRQRGLAKRVINYTQQIGARLPRPYSTFRLQVAKVSPKALHRPQFVFRMAHGRCSWALFASYPHAHLINPHFATLYRRRGACSRW
jgi:hypothetical protein